MFFSADPGCWAGGCHTQYLFENSLLSALWIFKHLFVVLPPLIPATRWLSRKASTSTGKSDPNAVMFLDLLRSVSLCLTYPVGRLLNKNTMLCPLSWHDPADPESRRFLAAWSEWPADWNCGFVFRLWFCPLLSTPGIDTGRSCYCCFPFSLPCQTRSFWKPMTS